MPNHVHVLVQIRETPLALLIKGWKGRIAREANKLLGRQGAFWFGDTDEQPTRGARVEGGSDKPEF